MGDFNKMLFLQLLTFCQVLRENLQGVFTVADNEEVREEKVQSQHYKDKHQAFRSHLLSLRIDRHSEQLTYFQKI